MGYHALTTMSCFLLTQNNRWHLSQQGPARSPPYVHDLYINLEYTGIQLSPTVQPVFMHVTSLPEIFNHHPFCIAANDRTQHPQSCMFTLQHIPGEMMMLLTNTSDSLP